MFGYFGQVSKNVKRYTYKNKTSCNVEVPNIIFLNRLYFPTQTTYAFLNFFYNVIELKIKIESV